MFKILIVSMLIVGMVFAECYDDETECGDRCCPEGYVIGFFFCLPMSFNKP